MADLLKSDAAPFSQQVGRRDRGDDRTRCPRIRAKADKVGAGKDTLASRNHEEG